MAGASEGAVTNDHHRIIDVCGCGMGLAECAECNGHVALLELGPATSGWMMLGAGCRLRIRACH